MRFPAKIASSCIWVAIPVDWVILDWYACGADGRSLGRCTVTWLPNFLGWVDYFIFLPMVLRWRASRARAPLSSFRAKAHLVFHWWLYNKFCYSLEGFLLLLLRVFHQMTWLVSSLQNPAPLKGEGTTQHHLGEPSAILSFFNGESPFFNWGCHRQPINALYAFFFMRYWDFLCNSRIFANLVFKNLDGNVNWERYSDRHYLNMGEDNRYSTVADRIWTTDLPNTGRSSFEPSCGKMSYMRFISDMFQVTLRIMQQCWRRTLWW